jgi:pilus assembly protein TadC
VITALGIKRGLKWRQTAADGLPVGSVADAMVDGSVGGGSGTAGSDDLDAADGLPLCVDLMAACLAAGASPEEAAGAVGRSLGGPLGTALIRAQAELRLGAEPAQCWQRLGRLPAAREMGRCLARASMTGAAPVAEMSRLAADCRARRARSALGRARRAAVLATAPLGLCFLPAFLLVGVAPVVIGLAGTVLGGHTG